MSNLIMRFDSTEPVTRIEPVIPPFRQVRAQGCTAKAYANVRALDAQLAAGSEWGRSGGGGPWQ